MLERAGLRKRFGDRVALDGVARSTLRVSLREAPAGGRRTG